MSGIEPNEHGEYEENPGWAEECIECGAITMWDEEGFGSEVCIECGGDTIEIPA